MNSFPGGFPRIYDDAATSNSHDNWLDQSGSDLRFNRASPEFEATRKSLKHRKKSLKKEMIHGMDSTTYIFMLITYLYDCSLLLLIMRIAIQSTILVFQYSPLLQQVIPKNAGKKSTFHLVIISNILAVLLHLLRELPKPEENGFLYGHHTLQVIGQTQLSSKYYFIGLDLLVFYLQVALFTSQYASKKNKTIRSSLVETEFDGYQGETIALKIPIVSALNLPFPSIDRLKQEEEEATSQQRDSNTNDDNRNNNDDDDLIDNILGSQAAYGSISSNVDGDSYL